jgi:hypothetical protein
MRKPLATLLLIAAASLAPSPVLAQDAAGAEALFQQAHQLFEQKRYAEACPKFAESYRLDKVSGALLALASCHEVEGKLASAWSEFVEVGTLARREGKNDRADAAVQRASQLEPKLAKLTVALAQGADTVQGLVVKRDGVVIGASAFGTALPVDRGEHVIEATAPGRAPFAKRLTMPDGARELVPIPLLAEAGATEAAPPGQPAPPAETIPDAKPVSPFPLRTLGIVTGVVGVVAVGVGGYFGVEAISKNNDSNQTGCNGDVCTGAGKQARLDAVSAGNTATALVVVGGVLAAGGLVMFLVGGPSSESKPAVAAAPVVGMGSAGVALTGRF